MNETLVGPTFYFLKDGKIVSSFAGWGAEGADSKAALIQGLRSIGLEPGAAE